MNRLKERLVEKKRVKDKKLMHFLKESRGSTVGKVKFSYFSEVSILLGIKMAKDEYFYYTEIKGKISGPYTFDSNASKSINALVGEKMKDKYVSNLILSEEGGLCAIQ